MGVNGTPILLSGNQGGSGWPSSRRFRSANSSTGFRRSSCRWSRSTGEAGEAHGGTRRAATLEKGDDAKELRRALKAAAVAVNRRVRFPFRGEEGSLSFYLEASGDDAGVAAEE